MDGYGSVKYHVKLCMGICTVSALHFLQQFNCPSIFTTSLCEIQLGLLCYQLLSVALTNVFIEGLHVTSRSQEKRYTWSRWYIGSSQDQVVQIQTTLLGVQVAVKLTIQSNPNEASLASFPGHSHLQLLVCQSEGGRPGRFGHVRLHQVDRG